MPGVKRDPDQREADLKWEGQGKPGVKEASVEPRGQDKGRLPGALHSPCLWTSIFLTAIDRGLYRPTSQGFKTNP